MLQLKQQKLLSDMTGEPVSELKPVSFGYSIHWTAVATYTLASQYVPQNESLIILRTQCYLVNLLTSATDYQFYRAIPEGLAWWYLGSDTSTNLQDWTNPKAPSQLAMDTDALILFPGGKYANLAFTPSTIAPTGTWQIRTTVFGFLVSPRVSDLFGGPQQWINVQM